MTRLKKKSWAVEIKLFPNKIPRLFFFTKHGYKNPSLEFKKNKNPSLGFEKIGTIPTKFTYKDIT